MYTQQNYVLSMILKYRAVEYEKKNCLALFSCEEKVPFAISELQKCTRVFPLPSIFDRMYFCISLMMFMVVFFHLETSEKRWFIRCKQFPVAHSSAYHIKTFRSNNEFAFFFQQKKNPNSRSTEKKVIAT